MRSICFLIAATLSFSARAQVAKKIVNSPETEIYVEVLPLQTQFRYEDSTEQTHATQRYDGWINLGFQYNQFRATYTQASHSDSSGAGSLVVETKHADQLVSIAFRFLQLTSTPQLTRLSFEMFGNGYAGTSQTKTDTKLFGRTSSAQSDPEAVFGLGVSVVGRAFIARFYGLSEVDLKVLYSNNFYPQAVPAAGLKVGVGYLF